MTTTTEPTAETTIPVDNEQASTGKGSAATALPPMPVMVTMQGEGQRPPLFLVTAGYSDVPRIFPLTQALGLDQPVHVLQVPRVTHSQQPSATLDSLVTYYIDAIQKVQPAGPYHLAGFGIGGVMAYEVACLLQMAQEQVNALILIETAYPAGNQAPYWSYLNAQAMNQFNQQVAKPLEQVGQQLAKPLQQLNQQLAKPLEQLQNSEWVQQLSRSVMGWRGSVDSTLMEKWKQLQADSVIYRSSLEDWAFEAHLRLSQSYDPPIYSGQVTLILAEDSPVRYSLAAWHWSNRVPNGLDCRLMPGSYATILHPPHVQGLAAQIASVLARESVQPGAMAA